jgi:hypothetical protein
MFNRLFASALIAAAALFASPAVVHAQGVVAYTSNPSIVYGMRWKGTYSNTATYGQNDVVQASTGGALFLSLVPNNTGNALTVPSDWLALADAPGTAAADASAAQAAAIAASDPAGSATTAKNQAEAASDPAGSAATVQTALNAEATTRASAVAANSTAITQVQTNLNTESTARATGDSTNAAAIAAETTARQSAINGVTSVPQIRQQYTVGTASGVTAHQLVKLDGSGNITPLLTSDTGALGIVETAAASGATAYVDLFGSGFSCQLDGTTSTINDILIASSTVAGACHDAGSSSSAIPLTTSKVGRALTATAASGTVTLFKYGPGDQGTEILPAQLPVFGASGSSHAPGAVPDPGAIAGTTHYLREDGTWQIPSGSGGSATLTAPTAYSSGTTYALGAPVTSGSTVYVSLSAGNIGNAVTNTSYWLPFAAAQGDGTSAVQALFGASAPTLGQIPIGTSGGVYAPGTLTPAAIGAVPTTPNPVTPLMDLHFTETSGTTAFDSSGNGNNGTYQTSHAPTPSAGGLYFIPGNGVDLPAAVNAAQTWCFVMYLAPVNQNSFPTSNVFYPVLSSTTGASGINFLLNYAGVQNSSYFESVLGAYSWSLMSGSAGAARDAINSSFSGTQRVCHVLNTTGAASTDLTYINGTQVDSYQTSTYNGGAQTTAGGHLSLGSSQATQWVNQGMPDVTMYRAEAFTAPLTAAQITLVDQNFKADLLQRGVPLTPQLRVLQTPHLIAIGDSITDCLFVSPSSGCWTSNLTITHQPIYTVSNYGVPSETALSIAGSEPNRVGPLCQSVGGPSIATLWEGTNDWQVFLYTTPQLVMNNISYAIQSLKNSGCKVLVVTMLSRGGNSGVSGTTNDGAKDLLNPLILSSAKALGADGVVDVAANPYLGADGANANPVITNCFNTDFIHPLIACQPYIETAFSNAINYYFGGYTTAVPYVVTASATLPSNAKVTDATGCAATCALVLPDGVGPVGEEYTIITGPNATTVQGQTLYGQTQVVNGSSAAVTLPTNTKVTLRIVALPQATAGVKWVM